MVGAADDHVTTGSVAAGRGRGRHESGV
jgi:hypothetical protein